MHVHTSGRVPVLRCACVQVMSPEAVHAHRSLVVHVGRSVLQGHVLCFVIGSGHRKETQVMTERCVEHVELGGARCMCFASFVVGGTAKRGR